MRRMSSKRPVTEPDAATREVAALAPDRAWSRVLAWQTRREHSREELADKLARLGADEALIEATLARLVDLGLQSDARVAEGIVRGQLQRGRGLRVIRQTLQRKGVAADAETLSALEQSQDWVGTARGLLQRRFGAQPAGDAREQARRVRFLQYRGFTLGQALAALRLDPDVCLSGEDG